MASSGRPDIGISAIPYAPIRQIRQNSLLPGLFPKSPSTVPFLSNFFKKFYLFTTAIAKTPRNGHTLSELFSKKALHSTGVISKTTPRCVATFGKNSEKHHHHTTDYQFFIPETLHCFQKKLKNFYFLTYHITDLELFLCHFRLKSKLQRSVLHSPSTGVISKICPSCAVVFRKNLKKTSPLHH